MDEAPAKKPMPRALKWLIFLALLPILIPVALLLMVVLLVMVIQGAVWSSLLYALIWLRWRERDTLFVYSDSPVWKDYLQQQLLPKIEDRIVLLNWSERRTWNDRTLAVLAFDNWAGQRAFNSIAIVFRPFKSAKVFRYWDAFKDFKHGTTGSVEELNRKLLAAMGV